MDNGNVLLFNDDEGELINWKIPNGSYVSKDTVILSYSKCNKIDHLKSHSNGIISFDKMFKKGYILKRGAVLGKLEPCRHEIVMKDLCASCGIDLRVSHFRRGDGDACHGGASVSMVHHVPELVVSHKMACEIGNRDRESLINARKLILLVDLDQTLIHSTSIPFDMNVDPDVKCYKLQSSIFYTKIRPYTREFLERMSKIYEMHIISYGERLYAHYIAHLLDPNKKYFGHRIMSRDELFCEMYKTKNIESLFPCGDHLIAIIDDRPDVWQYSDALIQVKPYYYFKGAYNSQRVSSPICPGLSRNCDKEASQAKIEANIQAMEGNGSSATSELMQPNNSCENERICCKSGDSEIVILDTKCKATEIQSNSQSDHTLEYIADILTKIHSRFYDEYVRSNSSDIIDVKTIIASERASVLSGCFIVLSGIVPIGTEIPRTEIYRFCKLFGAQVTEAVDSSTTHVIAARWGTTKVHQASKRADIAIVYPQWLYSCVEQWRKVDVTDHLVSREKSIGATQSTDRPLLKNVPLLPLLDYECLKDMENEVDESCFDDESEDDSTDTHAKFSNGRFQVGNDVVERKLTSNATENIESNLTTSSNCEYVEMNVSRNKRGKMSLPEDTEDDNPQSKRLFGTSDSSCSVARDGAIIIDDKKCHDDAAANDAPVCDVQITCISNCDASSHTSPDTMVDTDGDVSSGEESFGDVKSDSDLDAMADLIEKQFS